MSDEKKGKRVAFRITEEEASRYEAAAAREGRTLSDWARRALLAAAAESERRAKRSRTGRKRA